ncbi:MAG: hypothetical protein ACLRFH_00840 [Opitutales bacterium]
MLSDKNHNWQKQIKYMQIFIKTGLIFTQILLFIVRVMSALVKLITKMKIQSFIGKFSTIIGLIALTSFVQAAQFHLPIGTPGLVGQTHAPFAGNNPRGYEKVTIPGTNCDLFFPIDGFQPKTSLAGRYSGARYNGPNNDAVTDWWVSVFGGNKAVRFSRNPNQLKEPKMWFGDTNNPVHIIHVDTTGAGRGFSQEFWQVFRKIAEDPVGRVLLYRLLIEIRRFDDAGRNGCYEDRINTSQLVNRNKCRSILIDSANSHSFMPKSGKICFNSNNTTKPLTLIHVQNINLLTTKEEVRNNDIGLFHEMLHWFHFLRATNRLLNNIGNNANLFKYPACCYYGPVRDILYVWGSGGKVDAEEIATILGVPDYNNTAYHDYINQEAFLFYKLKLIAVDNIKVKGKDRYIPCNDKFLNGDDLSENVYRASKKHHMRFGHTNISIDLISFIPVRILLAHKVALDCYEKIMGAPPQNWELKKGQAIQ